MLLRALYICIILSVVGCSPQKRLERLVRKHPELVKSDTVYVHDTFTVQADTSTKAINDVLNKLNIDSLLPADYSKKHWVTDSIIDNIREQLRKEIQPIKGQIKEVYINKPCLIDTLVRSTRDGVKVKVWQQGSEIKIAFEYPQKINTVKPIKIEKAKSRWNGLTWLGFFVVVAIILAILFVIAKRLKFF